MRAAVAQEAKSRLRCKVKHRLGGELVDAPRDAVQLGGTLVASVRKNGARARPRKPQQQPRGGGQGGQGRGRGAGSGSLKRRPPPKVKRVRVRLVLANRVVQPPAWLGDAQEDGCLVATIRTSRRSKRARRDSGGGGVGAGRATARS